MPDNYLHIIDWNDWDTSGKPTLCGLRNPALFEDGNVQFNFRRLLHEMYAPDPTPLINVFNNPRYNGPCPACREAVITQWFIKYQNTPDGPHYDGD